MEAYYEKFSDLPKIIQVVIKGILILEFRSFYTKSVLFQIYDQLRDWFMPVQFNSVTQSCPTLCDPMDCSTPGFPVYHQLPEPT